METPEHQSQDTYQHGFDVIRLISSECGSSPPFVRSQITHSSTVIEIDDQVYTGDRFFIPVRLAAGKWVSVIGPERQWRMKFPTEPE